METQKINPFLNANATHSFFQKNNNMEGKVTPSMKQTILEKGLISYQTLDSYRTLVRNDALFLSNQSQPTLDQKQERRRLAEISGFNADPKKPYQPLGEVILDGKELIMSAASGEINRKPKNLQKDNTNPKNTKKDKHESTNDMKNNETNKNKESSQALAPRHPENGFNLIRKEMRHAYHRVRAVKSGIWFEKITQDIASGADSDAIKLLTDKAEQERERQLAADQLITAELIRFDEPGWETRLMVAQRLQHELSENGEIPVHMFRLDPAKKSYYMGLLPKATQQLNAQGSSSNHNFDDSENPEATLDGEKAAEVAALKKRGLNIRFDFNFEEFLNNSINPEKHHDRRRRTRHHDYVAGTQATLSSVATGQVSSSANNEAAEVPVSEVFVERLRKQQESFYSIHEKVVNEMQSHLHQLSLDRVSCHQRKWKTLTRVIEYVNELQQTGEATNAGRFNQLGLMRTEAAQMRAAERMLAYDEMVKKLVDAGLITPQQAKARRNSEKKNTEFSATSWFDQAEKRKQDEEVLKVLLKLKSLMLEKIALARIEFKDLLMAAPPCEVTKDIIRFLKDHLFDLSEKEYSELYSQFKRNEDNNPQNPAASSTKSEQTGGQSHAPSSPQQQPPQAPSPTTS